MEKDFDRWNKKKKKIEYYLRAPNFKEGEIWWYSAGINVGAEINGKHSSFERPIYVLFRCSKDMFVGIPCTTSVKKADYLHTFSKNQQIFTLNLSQIKSISSKRLIRKIPEIQYKGDILDVLIRYLKREPCVM